MSACREAIPVNYPIAIESQQRVWRAFANQYWRRLLIDANGKIRHHISARATTRHRAGIQRCWSGGELESARTSSIPRPAAQGGPDLQTSGPGELIRVGRTQNFDFLRPGWASPRVYAVPTRLRANHWGLAESGDEEHGAILNKGRGVLPTPFTPRSSSRNGGVEAGIAGSIPGSHRWAAPRLRGRRRCRAHGAGVAAEQRMYQLIRQQGRCAIDASRSSSWIRESRRFSFRSAELGGLRPFRTARTPMPTRRRISNNSPSSWSTAMSQRRFVSPAMACSTTAPLTRLCVFALGAVVVAACVSASACRPRF